VWVTLRELASPEARAPYRVRSDDDDDDDGLEVELPSFVHLGYTIWGLTERILSAIIGYADDGGARSDSEGQP
jgi:hypothetical protein